MVRIVLLRKTANIISKILGSLGVAFILLVWVDNIISSGEPAPMPDGREWEGYIMLATGATFLVGYIMGWFNRFYGSLIVLVSALIVSIPFAIIGNFGGLIFGVPIFLVSLLYFLAR